MIIDNKHNKQDNDNYKETTMKKIPLLLSLLALSSTAALAATSPFVPNGSITVNAMPQSIWQNKPPLRIPPLSRPKITSSGILSAFWSPNLSQANPNSPMPALSATCAKWVWSGKDSTGWVCTAKPAPTPPPQPRQQPPVTCTIIVQTFTCTTANGQVGGCTGANGQPAVLLPGTNTAVLDSTGQPVTCTSYN